MAARKATSLMPLILISLSLLFLNNPCLSNANSFKDCGFSSIYQFGDSFSDTGNYIIENPNSLCSRFPYGESLFSKPTGRCSDGLLSTDFYALASGIPLLKPYLRKDYELLKNSGGVNFAVGGASTLPHYVLEKRNIFAFNETKSTLSVQLQWMVTYFNSVSPNPIVNDYVEKNKRSLFVLGPFGGIDYSWAFCQGKTIREVMNLVPQVVQAIKNAVLKVTDYGAVRVIVPGGAPLGCLPQYLEIVNKNNMSSGFDKYHCHEDINNLVKYHNTLLKQALQRLRKKYPNVMIVYGDYYNAFQWVFRNSLRLGFDSTKVQKACCDSGHTIQLKCGLPGSTLCSNTDEYISWDGIHVTQKAYKYMITWIIQDILPKLNCGSNSRLARTS